MLSFSAGKEVKEFSTRSGERTAFVRAMSIHSDRVQEAVYPTTLFNEAGAHLMPKSRGCALTEDPAQPEHIS